LFAKITSPSLAAGFREREQQKKINKKEDQTELEERDEKGQWGEDPVYSVYHVTHV
jgi:tryptophanyl-tRNA synthetase